MHIQPERRHGIADGDPPLVEPLAMPNYSAKQRFDAMLAGGLRADLLLKEDFPVPPSGKDKWDPRHPLNAVVVVDTGGGTSHQKGSWFDSYRNVNQSDNSIVRIAPIQSPMASVVALVVMGITWGYSESDWWIILREFGRIVAWNYRRLWYEGDEYGKPEGTINVQYGHRDDALRCFKALDGCKVDYRDIQVRASDREYVLTNARLGNPKGPRVSRLGLDNDIIRDNSKWWNLPWFSRRGDSRPGMQASVMNGTADDHYGVLG